MIWRNDHLKYDWFHRALPVNAHFGPNVYIESSYVFAGFFSEQQPGIVMGEASGLYDLSSVVAGPNAHITIGPYTCLNSSNVVCQHSIQIGAHCLIAWGTVITD